MKFTREVYNEYRSPLRIIASRFKQVSGYDSSDLLQEGMIAVWKALKEYDETKAGKQSKRSFAISKAKYSMIDFIRQQSPSRFKSDEGVKEGHVKEHIPLNAIDESNYSDNNIAINQINDTIDYKKTFLEQRAALVKAFHKVLTPRQRAIMLSYYFDEISTEAIGRKFSITGGTVQSHITQSKKALQKELNIDATKAISKRFIRVCEKKARGGRKPSTVKTTNRDGQGCCTS